MEERKRSGRMIAMRNTFIIVYTILTATVFSLTCVHFLSTNSKALLAQSENYTASAAYQGKQDIQNYCDGIERSQFIIFDDSQYTNFYPLRINPSGEELMYLTRITQMLTKASYFGNCADLGVIYRNGLTAGIVTDGTKDLLGANVFQRSVSLLGGKSSNWTVLYYGNVSRACWFKKLNDNAVFIASFYVSNLADLFPKTAQDNNVVFYLTDKDDRVIFATENMDITTGDRMPYELVDRFKGGKNLTVGDQRGAASLLTLKNNWRIYSVVQPVKTGRFGADSSETFILIIGLSIFIIFISAGFIIAAFFTAERKPRKLVEEKLDKVTGVLSAFYFEEEASDLIETALLGGTWAFTKVVIKDQEVISERLGEDFIEGGMQKLSTLLRSHFGENTIIGINEDKEFMLFTDFSDFDIFKAHDYLKVKHEECLSLFKKLLVGDDEDYKLNVAVGVCIYPDNGRDFDELDYKAGIALAESLKLNGDSLVFYDDKHRTGGADK